MRGQDVHETTERCAGKLEETREGAVNDYLNLLDEFDTILHPNHYTSRCCVMSGFRFPNSDDPFLKLFADMTIKKYLADIYGNKEGFKYNQLSASQIDLKIKYAQEFLSVVGVVDPGTTKVST